MGKASQLYMNQNFGEASALLKDIIRISPNYTEPYHLLGLMEGNFHLLL